MKLVTRLIALILGSIISIFSFNQCSRSKPVEEGRLVKLNDSLTLVATLISKDNFNKDLTGWIAEEEIEGGVKLVDEKMDIDAAGGSTTWWKGKLHAPLMIEYDAVVVQNSGPNDRVSDLNCFWLALDPDKPDDFFNSYSQRRGIFKNYDDLSLYYVGLGGHNNTKTRFRRYDGEGNKPLMPEHDLSSEEFLIKPNQLNRIKIIVYNGIVQYYRNDQLIYNFYDQEAYDTGYFGIRTVHNHLTVDNFTVYSLKNTTLPE